jgi:putative membrane protein
LWGSKGRQVRTRGTLVEEGEKIYLKDGTVVELLFTEEALHEALAGHLGETLTVDGTVCYATVPPRSKGLDRRVWAFFLVLASGALGLAVLDCPGLCNMNVIPVTRLGLPVWGWAFLPLFTGLFGLPTLLMSLSSRPTIPQQYISMKERISRKEKAKGLAFGTFTGSFLSWFPGITSSEAALLASQASASVKRDEDEEDGGKATERFMVTVSAINVANALSNFVALFVILRTRSGAAKATGDILGSNLIGWDHVLPVPWQLGLILIAILVSSTMAYFMTMRLAKLFAEKFHRVPYRKLVLGIIVFLVILVVMMSGPLGVMILVIATLLGLIPPTVGVRRVHLIGALIVPVLFSSFCGSFGWGSMV